MTRKGTDKGIEVAVAPHDGCNQGCGWAVRRCRDAGHMPGSRNDTKAGLCLRPDIRVTADTPPTFLVMAEDDHVDGVEQVLA